LRVSSVEEAEQLALAIARQVGEALVTEGVKQVAGKASYEGCSVACSCGRKAKFKEYRPRWVVTLCGSVQVARAYYYCRHCHSGQSPWDRRQGLSAQYWTAGVKQLVSSFVGRLSYAETVELLELSTGLRLVESVAEKIADEVGPRLRGLWEQQRQAVLEEGVWPLATPAPTRLYVGLDGTRTHIDGSWHEVKVGVIYEAETNADGLDEAVRCEYVAAQEAAQEFGERVYCAAAMRGVQQADEVVVIGDGADWIWNLAAHHYPGATEIVDFWHACEHIWELRRVLYPAESAAGDRWAREHCERLRTQGPAGLLRTLDRARPPTAEAAAKVATEQGYFRRHRQRMAYPQFRARGLMIGSGPVEAACKVVVGQRLKRAGMRWCHRGADAVLAIRCTLLNGHTHYLQEASKAA
jgi:hypothetical protein